MDREKGKEEMIKKKYVCLIVLIVFLVVFLGSNWSSCSWVHAWTGNWRSGLVVIKGKATIINFPNRGEVPATTETLIFQKVGCEDCFVGARVDIDGNYKLLVGGGKYKIIVRNPTVPEVDLLAPDQPRIIDTGSENSPTTVFDFDIKIKLPDEPSRGSDPAGKQ